MARTQGLPSNLYAGDAVVFNNQGYTNYYLKRAAEKQAKDEALDQYYNKLHTNINPVGMRLQDIEGGFNKEVEDWQKHYMDNAEKIKNPKLDNGRAYNEHFAKYQNLLSRTQESKNAAAQEMDIAKAKLNGKFDPTDDDLPVLHGIGASIYSPEHYTDPETKVQPYGLEHLSPNVPEFGVKEQTGFLKASQNGYPQKPTYDNANTIIDKKAGKQFTRMYHQYNGDELKGIGNQAADLYNGDKIARKHFQLAMHDPNEYNDLNTAYKQVYGQDATNPQQLAQGWVLSHANKTTELGQKESKYVNPDTFYQHLGAREASQKRLKVFAKSLGLKEGDIDDNDPMESAVSQIEKNAQPGNRPLYPSGGGTVNAQNIPMTPELKKIFTRQNGVHMVTADEFKKTEDGNFIGNFYQKNEDGTPKIENGKFLISKTLAPVIFTRDQLKSALASQILTKKSQEKRLNSMAAPAQPKIKQTKLAKGALD